MKSETHKIEIWKDLDKEPEQIAYWKVSDEIHGSGKTNTFTVSSIGHHSMPSLFDMQVGNGTLSRITEFNKAGEIARFLVLYFPPNGSGNVTKMDMHFGGKGMLKSVLLRNGNPDESGTMKAPFDPNQLRLVNKNLFKVKGIEKVKSAFDATSHKLKPENYPQIQVLTNSLE